MISRNTITFFKGSVIAVVIALLVGCSPALPEPDRVSEAETGKQVAFHPQNVDPQLLVPESTMGQTLRENSTQLSDFDVAVIPESTMRRRTLQDFTQWDANPVAYIPESTIKVAPGSYQHNWANNPVATIPESTMQK